VHDDVTYCTEASLAIRVCQGIVGIRVERVHRIRLTANLESNIYLSIARYDPYLAKTFDRFQGCTGNARIYRVRHLPLKQMLLFINEERRRRRAEVM
jgi:hypothetical protein